MGNSFFQFKQFTVHQDRCAMKVTTDACLFGAWVAGDLQQNKNSKTLLDIGTGTGLLSLMIVQGNPQLLIDAIEIDAAAAKQAEENITASEWKDRVTLFHQDIKKMPTGKKYDLIISNPPFYENELQSENAQRNIAHHSNNLSLNELLKIIKINLRPDGSFYLLLPFKRNNEIENLLKENELFILKKLVVRQSIQHDYFRIMIKGSLNKIFAPEEKEISIKNNNQEYTEEFTRLLKDYYLYL